jgi:hypothetical protein
MVLLVVLSGFIGRYLMSHISRSLREKEQRLRGLQLLFEQMGDGLTHRKVEPTSIRSTVGRAWSWLGGQSQTEKSASSVSAVVGGIADLEYSIAVHGWMKNGWMKNCFQKWLRFHLVISGVLGVLLALHACSGVYYGLRWFQ